MGDGGMGGLANTLRRGGRAPHTLHSLIAGLGAWPREPTDTSGLGEDRGRSGIGAWAAVANTRPQGSGGLKDLKQNARCFLTEWIRLGRSHCSGVLPPQKM